MIWNIQKNGIDSLTERLLLTGKFNFMMTIILSFGYHIGNNESWGQNEKRMK